MLPSKSGYVNGISLGRPVVGSGGTLDLRFSGLCILPAWLYFLCTLPARTAVHPCIENDFSAPERVQQVIDLDHTPSVAAPAWRIRSLQSFRNERQRSNACCKSMSAVNAGWLVVSR